MKSQSNHHRRRKGALALAVVTAAPLLLIILFVHNARAFALQSPHATICVKPGGGDGCQPTISNALAIAGDGDTIQVAAGEYVENLTINRTVTLEGGWNDAFTMRDPQTYPVTIRPADQTQTVVSIENAHPTVDGFTITGGRADTGNNHGGGLRLIDSNALLRNNRIVNNRAYLFGGGVWVQRGAPTFENNRIEDNTSVGPNQSAYGGGIHLENSQATLSGNGISANVVSGTNAYGGGIGIVGDDPVYLLENEVSGNQAIATELAVGGGIGVNNAAEARLAYNRVAANQAIANSGPPFADVHAAGGGIGLRGSGELQSTYDLIHSNAVSATASAGVDPLAYGGGLYLREGRLLLHTAAISQNVALSGGGAYLRDTLIELDSSTIAENQANSGGGLVIYSPPEASVIRDSAINQNSASSAGGGLIHLGGALTIHGSTIVGNVAEEDEAGGIYTLYRNAGDALTVTGSTIANNVARVAAGIYAPNFLHVNRTSIRNNVAGEVGGGMVTRYESSIVDSTIAHNESGSYGAALLHSSNQPITVQNVTISSNDAASAGAIYFDGDGALTNVTITGNRPTGVFWQSGDVATQNTIFAANAGPNCNAPLLTLGYNLEDADDCGLDAGMNDLLFTDPVLGPLADNGGDTQTHALDLASPAIDAADDGACTGYDQRGRPRADGDFDGDITCDIGAFEYLSSFIVNTTGDAVDDDQGDGVCETAPGNAQCSLRAAIQEANALGGADLISVPAGLYALTIPNLSPTVSQAPTYDTDDFAATGDLDIRAGMRIAGAGASETIVDAQELDRVFDIISPAQHVDSPPQVYISDLTVRNGRAENDYGGGIYNDGVLTVWDSVVESNHTTAPNNDRAGGGIFNNRTLILQNTVLAENESNDGGALFLEGMTSTRLQQVNIRDNVASQSGGGISNSGVVTVTQSTISGNSAVAANGGAIHNSDSILLRNSTISGNEAGFNGGGVFNNSGVLTMTAVTVYDNQATNQAPAIYNDDRVTLHNTIVAGSGDQNCLDNDTLVSAGYNLEDANTCNLDPALGDLFNADPRLEPLADNGGATPTHALQTGSPAIDAGDPLHCPATDQRGIARPLDGDNDGHLRCDIGAFELQYEEDQEDEEPTFALHLPIFFR